MQGGASGAIVVDGIENLQPAVAGSPERMLLLRDQIVAGGVTAPFVTLNVNTGPDGDNEPTRTLATIQFSNSLVPTFLVLPQPSGPANPQRLAGLANARPATQPTLAFSEVLQDPTNPAGPTVDGQRPVLFNTLDPPAIPVASGSRPGADAAVGCPGIGGQTEHQEYRRGSSGGGHEMDRRCGEWTGRSGCVKRNTNTQYTRWQTQTGCQC